MQRFDGRIAVVTGGGSGMGRELVRQLMQAGCHVAACDVLPKNLEETARVCQPGAISARLTTHVADVSDETQMRRFRDEVGARHETDRLHLLFNNAGIAGGGSLFTDSRESWERTFNVCWYGVYHGVRTFLPMLQKADEAHIVNVSSINGFWASAGPQTPFTAYSAAKFAVRGFTEALITDLAVNAPHIGCSVVMPGHVGTQIRANSRKVMNGSEDEALTSAERARMRARWQAANGGDRDVSDGELQALMQREADLVARSAPTSAEAAARIMLEGVRARRWRILLGEDAVRVDEGVRATPEAAYTPEFFERYGTAIGRAGHSRLAF